MKTTLAVLALLLLAGVSRADSIWNYQGKTMPGCNCALSGSVTLDSSNQAVTWDFSAGTDYGGGGYLEGNRGVWTEVWPTAEPDTLVLIGVGLVGLLARRRFQARRKQVPEGDWESL